jgi:hypothetical protein
VDTPSPTNLEVSAITEEFLPFFNNHLEIICIRILANEAGLGVLKKNMNDDFLVKFNCQVVCVLI